MQSELTKVYHKETGKSAWQSWGPPDCINEDDPQGYLEVYVEAPSVDYIKWLESRGSKSGDSKNSTPPVVQQTHTAISLSDVEEVLLKYFSPLPVGKVIGILKSKQQ